MTLSTTINKYAYITVRELPPFFKFKHRIQYLKEEVNSLEKIKHPVVREALKFLDVKKVSKWFITQICLRDLD